MNWSYRPLGSICVTSAVWAPGPLAAFLFLRHGIVSPVSEPLATSLPRVFLTLPLWICSFRSHLIHGAFTDLKKHSPSYSVSKHYYYVYLLNLVRFLSPTRVLSLWINCIPEARAMCQCKCWIREQWGTALSCRFQDLPPNLHAAPTWAPSHSPPGPELRLSSQGPTLQHRPCALAAALNAQPPGPVEISLVSYLKLSTDFSLCLSRSDKVFLLSLVFFYFSLAHCTSVRLTFFCTSNLPSLPHLGAFALAAPAWNAHPSPHTLAGSFSYLLAQWNLPLPAHPLPMLHGIPMCLNMSSMLLPVLFSS